MILHESILTDAELKAAEMLAKSMANEPDDLAKERFLWMILQAWSPGKMGMSEYDRAEICKVLQSNRKA